MAGIGRYRGGLPVVDVRGVLRRPPVPDQPARQPPARVLKTADVLIDDDAIVAVMRRLLDEDAADIVADPGSTRNSTPSVSVRAATTSVGLHVTSDPDAQFRGLSLRLNSYRACLSTVRSGRN